MNQDFWRDRKVFITGHTGFKGSWLLLLLRQLGAQVSGYSLPPPTQPNMFELLDLADACHHHEGDVRDLDALRTAVRDAAPEIVIHMAAQPLVRASYETPVETYATNVMGTVNLLEACRGVPGLRSIVVVTTDKCYENVGSIWGYRESDRLGGADPYSNSKAAAELVVDGYRASFFRDAQVGLASARAGNVIGGGDFAADRLIPDAMRAFMAGRSLQIRNPASIRPWQHVLEPLSGYLMLAERLHGDLQFAEGWNFGPRIEESVPVRDVVDRLAERWGRHACWEEDGGDHPHEAPTLKLDSTKAILQLGWKPQLDLGAALDLTTDWYDAFHARGDIATLSEEQVRAYLARVGAAEAAAAARVKSRARAQLDVRRTA